jgi:hypothetical protein
MARTQDATAPEAPEVETLAEDANSEVEDTTGAAETATAAPAKETKPKFEPPEGFVTPIQFRAKLVETGRAPESLRPQVVYSYVKNISKVNPLPVQMHNGRPVINLEGGLAWWDKKEELKKERAANAADKAAKKAAKAAESPTSETPAEAAQPTEEAE